MVRIKNNRPQKISLNFKTHLQKTYCRMKHTVGFRKPKSQYGARPLPLGVLIWIRKAGVSKDDFINLYPPYNFKKEGFPQVFIERVQERRAARIDNLKQLERDIAKDIEKLSLKCGCNNHTKDFKRPCKQNLPKTKRLRKIGESIIYHRHSIREG